MRKPLLTLITILVIHFTANSQTTLALETDVITHTYTDNTKCSFRTIACSLKNLRSLLLTDMNSFKATMLAYNYALSTDSKGYLLNLTCALQDYYSISKSTGSVNFIYTGDNDLTSLRKEIQQLYPNTYPKFVSGFEIYPTPVTLNGKQLKLQVYIQESQEGGGLVVIKHF